MAILRGVLSESSEALTITLRVRGVVQGVGFRPFIYRLAHSYDLSGWVLNDVNGVLIQASGPSAVLEQFTAAIAKDAPPAAKVEDIQELERQKGLTGTHFVIEKSAAADKITTLISPDLSICPDCLSELFNPSDPRYRYPYINCTNCGPRYSIIEALPYDRPLTTMKDYPLCEPCEGEYHDPVNRRFHAQPVACPDCGPNIHYLDEAGQELASGDRVIKLAATALKEGQILAIKGLGGYHLACDAKNEAAVLALRQRKFRKEKPFALMVRSLADLQEYVVLDEVAQTVLNLSSRPIVLLPKGSQALPEALAPDNAELGVMLPYTPLHHLLFEAGAPSLLVMTSANRSSEPIAIKDDEALERLSGIAKAFLVGERPIARRVDDSVVSIMAGEPVILRRARGYAPAPVLRSERFERPVLALGAGLKNSITLANSGYAFVSQHLGDLDNLDAFTAFSETIADLCQMYNVNLADALIIHDLHPEYPSSRYAETLPGKKIAVQHHRAHIASVLAEQQAWDKTVLGFSFDGSGLGNDGNIWGGEIFYGSLNSGFKRVGHLQEAWLPGGDSAARYPEQAAVGFLHGLSTDLWQSYLAEKIIKVANSLINSGINTPKTSSMGRLFDTVAALCGFKRRMTFEGQAAIWLETQARKALSGKADFAAEPTKVYPLPFNGQSWDYRPLLEAILYDKQADTEASLIAWRFHHGLARALSIAATNLSSQYSFDTIVLSGGVWQNKLLHSLAVTGMQKAGFKLWWNKKVPPGDGGISLGQLALAVSKED